MFKCTCCGLCCKHLKYNKLYTDLDRGDGICRYFDVSSNLCSIYKDRPLKCNVDKFYQKNLKDIMPIENYYKMNYDVCKSLQEKERV